MKRLTVYLARLFATDALLLFAVVSVLLWMINCLRSFDVVSVKGQGLLTLAWQGLLTMPPLALAFMYICVGIGLARALQALQANHELHIIHTAHGLGALLRATALVCALSVLAVLVMSNFVEPYASKQVRALQASVAADLVSTTLKPGRFTQVTPGVLLLIGGRSGVGEINEFFADDRRDEKTRRTYIAKSATISRDVDGYVLELRQGSIQYIEDGRFSEVSFGRYDLGVEQLTQPAGQTDDMWNRDSVTLITEAMATGVWSSELIKKLTERLAEGLRVVGICMLVLGFSGFPSGRRIGIAIPMEAVVLALGIVERGVTAYSPLGPATGAMLMIIVGAVVLVFKMRPRALGSVAA
ncbi:LptF/LptG family permease [Devosia sp.]|uniref:LptF/LptG family permease n=1 Tax=Devosia sp. TaxID=1871048 RepID=UPI0032673E4E